MPIFKRLLKIGLIVCPQWIGRPAAAELPRYWELALSANPGLRAEQEAWQAERAAADMALGFDDPLLSWTRLLVGIDSDDETRPNMWMLEQELPGWGKRSRRHERGLSRAVMAQQNYLIRRNDLLREVTRAYLEHAFLTQQLQIVREQSEFVRMQESVLAARYRATASEHPDLIRARIELLRLEDQIRAAEAELLVVATEFNALLGQGGGTAFPWPIELEGARLELPPLAELRDRIEQRSLALRSIDAQIDYYENSRRAALSNRRPDFMLGLQTPMIEPVLEHDDSDAMNAWWATLSVRLPLANGEENAAAKEAQAMQRSSEYMRQQESLMLQAKLERLWFERENAVAKATLLRDRLVPLAQQGQDALGARVQTGEAGFVTWLEAVHTLFELQLELAAEVRDEALASVELLALVDALPVPEVGEKP